jgi:hypothetical protein
MHGDMHGSKPRNRAYLDGHKDVVPGLQDTHDAKPPLKFTFRHETVSGKYHAVVWLNNTGLYGERRRSDAQSPQVQLRLMKNKKAALSDQGGFF